VTCAAARFRIAFTGEKSPTTLRYGYRRCIQLWRKDQYVHAHRDEARTHHHAHKCNFSQSVGCVPQAASIDISRHSSHARRSLQHNMFVKTSGQEYQKAHVFFIPLSQHARKCKGTCVELALMKGIKIVVASPHIWPATGMT
jgi:hypothetical protein